MVFLEWPGRNQTTTEVMYARICVRMYTCVCCRKGKQIRCKGPEAQHTLILFKELGERPGPMPGMTLGKVRPGERDRVGVRWVGRTENKLLCQHASGSLSLPPCVMPAWHSKIMLYQNYLLKIIEDTGLKPKASTARGKFSEAQSCFSDLRVGWILNIQIKPCTIELAKIY